MKTGWSKFIAFAMFALMPTMAFSGKETKPSALSEADLEKVRLQIFAEGAKSPSCKIISRGPGVKLESIDASLQLFTSNLLDALKNTKEEQLETFFHPRLKGAGNIGRRLFATLRNRYATPWDFSVSRVFALYTVSGEKLVLPCPDDNIAITALYGYPIQFGIVFSMMAQNELSRIFALVVPRQGVWYVGGFHIQQWTFMSKDFEAWANEGIEAMKSGDNTNAYLKFDIAQKMLFGGDFLSYPIKEKILESRAAAMSKEGFLDKIKQTSKNSALVYAGTALLNDGPGILIRERLTKDVTTPEIKEACTKSAKAMLDAGTIKPDMGGVQCDFIYPGENPKKQGQVGGFYLSHKQIAESAPALIAIPPVAPPRSPEPAPTVVPSPLVTPELPAKK